MNRGLKSVFATWILIIAGTFVLVKITDDINELQDFYNRDYMDKKE